MFKSSTCYGRTCRLLGKSKAKCILWGEGKCEVKIHLCGGVETGASCQTDSWPLPCYRFCSKL